MAITEQQYRVIGKSGPGVDWRSLPGDTMIRFAGSRSDTGDKPRLLGASAPMQDWWDNARYEILEAISPPQAGKCGRPLMPASHVGVPCGRPSGHAPVSGLCEPPPQAAKCGKIIGGLSGDLLCNREAGHEHMRSCKWEEANGPQEFAHPQAAPVVCLAWCGLPVSHRLVPAPSQATRFFACIFPNGCHGKDCGGHRAYCTQACLDRAKAAKAPECIRSACKIPPVAGGELCAAHAGQVEAAKAAAPPAAPAPAETRLERWRRTHPGYSHATADQRLHDANVAAMMMGIDGPREPYVPAPKPDPWTPRDLDGDIPDAWELGGARLGCTR